MCQKQCHSGIHSSLGCHSFSCRNDLVCAFQLKNCFFINIPLQIGYQEWLNGQLLCMKNWMLIRRWLHMINFNKGICVLRSLNRDDPGKRIMLIVTQLPSCQWTPILLRSKVGSTWGRLELFLIPGSHSGLLLASDQLKVLAPDLVVFLRWLGSILWY